MNITFLQSDKNTGSIEYIDVMIYIILYLFPGFM